MLERKAMASMQEWKRSKTHQALLVAGARQVGKTYLVREFARQSYQNVIEINLLDDRDANAAFSTARNSRELFMRITAFADKPLVPGQTAIFLDEVQECKEMVTAIKFLVERGEYDYILSGSMLGVELRGIRSAPVGYLTGIDMYPLDFEEYCWANGVSKDMLAEAELCFASAEPIDEFIHKKLLGLFHRYLISGGMPDPVQAFVSSDDINQARTLQGAIVEQYRYDISKYARGRERVVKRIFDLLPSEISQQDKRFVAGDIEGDSHIDRYLNDFMWLADANVALPAFSVSEPRYPLKASMESKKFKLFSSDVGILTYQCGMDVVRDMLANRSDINFGALYENAVAQELKAHGFEPLYFKNRTIGELDFVVQWPYDQVLPIEVKSGKTYKRHSALNKVLEVPNYGIEKAFVFHDGNVEKSGKLLYLQIYAIMWLRRG